MAQVLSGTAVSGQSPSSNTWVEWRWTATQSGNVSTINWQLWYCGTSGRARLSQIYFTLTQVSGGGTLSKTGQQMCYPFNSSRPWVPQNPPEINNPLDSTLAGDINSGSFTVTHNNGVGKFTVQVSANIYEHNDVRTGPATTFELPTTTTSCVAPTSVTITTTGLSGNINDDLVAPTGKIKIAWSGANNGTNNTINGYDVYYRVTKAGSSPTASSYTGIQHVDSTAKSGNYTFTLDLASSTRGYKLVAGVRTCGSGGSSFYSTITTKSGITINSLPAAPSFQSPYANKTAVTLKSNDSAIVVSATEGADPDSKQCEVWISTTSNGSDRTQAYQETFDPAEGGSKTRYFWTFDGTEYSASYTAMTVTRNIKPSVTGVSQTQTTYTIGGVGAPTSNTYNRAYAYEINPTVKCNKANCTVIVIPEIKMGTQTSIGTGFTWTSLTQCASKTVGTSNVALGSCRIFDRQASTSAFSWRLRIYATDNLETSDPIYFPRLTASGGSTYYTDGRYYYQVGDFITSHTFYNQFSTSNVANTQNNQVYRQLRVAIPEDTSRTGWTASVENITGITQTTSVSSNTRFIDITLPDNLASWAEIKVTVSASDPVSGDVGTSLSSKTLSTIAHESLVPNLTAVGNSYPSTIYPFSTSGSFTLSIANPFPNTWANYNIANEQNVNLRIAKTQATTTSYIVSGASEWSHSGNNFVKTFNKQSLFSWSNPFSYTYNTSYTYYVRLEVTNLFGKTFTTTWQSATFDFRENLQSVTVGQVFWNTTGSGTFTNLDNQSAGRMWGGMYLKFQPTINYYTKGNITVQLKNSSGTVLKTATVATAGATNSTAVATSTSFIIGPIGPFTATSTTSTYTYTVSAAFNGTTVSSSSTHLIGRLTNATHKLSSASVTKDTSTNKYNLTYQVSSGDYGTSSLTNTYTISRNIVIGGTTLIAVPTTASSNTVATNLTSWNVQEVELQTVVAVSTKPNPNVNTAFTTTLVTDTTPLIVYSESPTVAYRPNQIGINTDTLTSEQVLVVQATSGKKLVLLRGANKVISVDLEESRIY